MSGSESPQPWTPSKAERPLIAGNVAAGDWAQVEISFREGSTPVAFGDDHFLIHVLVKPCSDDSISHPDQPTTFGGSATKGNRRSTYRIDPGVCFQAPFNSQLYVVAGGDSPLSTHVDIVIRRGFVPRVAPPAPHLVDMSDVSLDPLEAIAMGAMMEWSPIQAPGRRMFAPPVVGLPQRMPATWVRIAAETPIELPDGAQEIEVVDDTGVPGSPIALNFLTLGTLFRVTCASGIRRSIAHLAQGGACPDGTPATWESPAVALGTATVWSSFGC